MELVKGQLINETSETDLGVQPEEQRNKAVTDSYLDEFEMAILPPGNVRKKQSESCLLPLYNPL